MGNDLDIVAVKLLKLLCQLRARYANEAGSAPAWSARSATYCGKAANVNAACAALERVVPRSARDTGARLKRDPENGAARGQGGRLRRERGQRWTTEKIDPLNRQRKRRPPRANRRRRATGGPRTRRAGRSA